MIGRFARGGRAVVDVRRGERLLATAEGPETAIGGTREALYLPQRIAWEQVAAAGWDDESSTLRVTEVAAWGEAVPVHTVALDEPDARLLQLVRERVTATIVLQREVAVRGRLSARVLARRAPHGTGPLAWFVEYDEGLDPDDPSVRSAVDDALARARHDVGD